MKKIVSILICVIMTLSFIPFSSSADDVSSSFELTFVASSNVATRVTVRAVDRSGESFPVRCTKTTFDVNFDGDLKLSTIFAIATAGNYRLADVRYGSPDGPSIDYIAQRYRRGVQTVFFLSGIDYSSGRFTDQYNGEYVNAVDVVSSMSLFTHETPVYLIYDDRERNYPVIVQENGRADVILACDMSSDMFTEVSPGVTRRDVVLDEVSRFAERLLAHNAGSDVRVRVGLNCFGNSGKWDFPFFTKFSGAGGFEEYLEGQRAVDYGAGRNWEEALDDAWWKLDTGEDNGAERYVILISESTPTTRTTKGPYSYFGTLENYGAAATDPATGNMFYSRGYSTAGDEIYRMGVQRNLYPALVKAKALVREPRDHGGGAELRTVCVFDDSTLYPNFLKYYSDCDPLPAIGVPVAVDGCVYAADGDELASALEGLYDEISSFLPTPAPTVTPGDADGDGIVNLKDVYLMKKMIAGSAANTPGADVDGNGAVNMVDLYLLKKAVAG